MGWSTALRGVAAAGLVAGAVRLEILQRSAASLQVHFDPPAPLAGQTVRVEAAGAGPGAFCQLGPRRSPFFPLPGGRSRALIPVPLGSEGMRPVVVLGAEPRPRESRALSALAWLDISERILPLRRIRLPRRAFRLFNDPGVPAAHKKLAAALKTLTPEQLWSGRFDLPAVGLETSVFGSPRRLNRGKKEIHRGIDIAVPPGSAVRAANSGVVLIAGKFPLEGRMVLIDHGQGVLSGVFHLRRALVRAGQRVAKGQVIGRAGNEGISTGSHVHWAMYVHGVPVDPMDWAERDF